MPKFDVQYEPDALLVMTNSLSMGHTSNGFQGLGGCCRTEVMNNCMGYSLGPVLCNFNKGFAGFATFRQLASAHVFPGRTSIRPQLDNVFA